MYLYKKKEKKKKQPKKQTKPRSYKAIPDGVFICKHLNIYYTLHG